MFRGRMGWRVRFGGKFDGGHRPMQMVNLSADGSAVRKEGVPLRASLSVPRPRMPSYMAYS